jgi:hypothetical protein
VTHSVDYDLPDAFRKMYRLQTELSVGMGPDEWLGPARELVRVIEAHLDASCSDPGFEVLTARAICELPEPDRDVELLGPLVVAGQRTVVGGYTGEGKTSFVLRLVKAITAGEEFLEWTGAGGRALIVDAEQGLRTIKRRLREVGLEKSDLVDYLQVPDGLALDGDSDARRLEQVLTGGAYDLVLADPLYKLHRGDSNEERHAVDLMRRLDQWRADLGFALLLTTHPRKRQPQGTRFTIDELFGSGAYTRGAEVVLGLKRLRPGYSRLHFFKDRDGDLPSIDETWGLLFDQERGFRRDPEDGQVKPSAADRVSELLVADPGMSMEQLETASGYKERTVRDALKALGAVGSGKPKRWTLTSTQEALDT